MFPLTQDLINKHCPNGPGIYKVYLYNTNGQPVAIQRAFGLDERGLIYIGVSKANLRARLSMFRRVSTPGLNTTSHSGARKYKVLKARLDRVFPGHQLFFDFEVMESADLAKRREESLLSDTRVNFGDTPLLNG